MSGKRDIYLVIGGSGFLGRHVVEALLARGDSVSVFDIVQRHHDVPFYSGDISEEEQVSDALRKSGATCIIHTASPLHGLDDPALYWKVNVDGTQAVINAAVANGVPKLVYTSSAGVVFDGSDLIDVDERIPGPEKAMDPYNESKAKAEEIVLAANGKGGLYTVALRPAGIFGPGDRQMIAGLFQVWQRGQSHIQLGDNTNLFDWTYVGNCAYAHLLAADRLIPTSEKDALRVKDELDIALPPISATLPRRRVPTSLARPLGPYVDPPPNAEQIKANWENPDYKAPVPRPAIRGKFDQFSEAALARETVSPLQVAGQVFFITNGEPTGFWDLPRLVYGFFDNHFQQPNNKRRWILPQQLGFILASAAEWWAWMVGKEPGFTRYRVTYSCAWRCFNIDRARRVLGYEPQVGLEEGIKRTFEWWVAERQKAGKAQ
ncbi:3-beta hydroxysteroid dehydrogenase/isomerase [Dichomitus squalens]|uniref:3-beta hydroxysteroid dehydrogenase/isomerase n=1 Tax=Dichomitus squalens TaxID=114155 RepID=A0A4Q9NWD2_9APHY|nr:3-beta hydroxysteroid dehydrogenase/isomerase [Dichomitus squalens LYAD-421 SS1]EJF63159.1 3-beta hydroxysteroid dehydrogenase/isomerase [Dichomitus squalens LYAD-421 SS1]TBU44512.1 3-beta hydroxysteroid dehydrogenase/isomerase [Dichomitus squalens]TBU54644.1 3-beta hydroxysteroid dehydrogenase/isomerase [Dichomitus squalens]